MAEEQAVEVEELNEPEELAAWGDEYQDAALQLGETMRLAEDHHSGRVHE